MSISITTGAKDNDQFITLSSLPTQVIGFSVLEFTVNVLLPFSEYSFTIAAVNSNGLVGNATDPLYLFTPEAGMCITEGFTQLGIV